MQKYFFPVNQETKTSFYLNGALGPDLPSSLPCLDDAQGVVRKESKKTVRGDEKTSCFMLDQVGLNLFICNLFTYLLFLGYFTH